MAEGKRNLPAFAIGQPLRGPPGQVPPRPGAFAGGFQSMIDPRAAAGMLSAIYRQMYMYLQIFKKDTIFILHIQGLLF